MTTGLDFRLRDVEVRFGDHRALRALNLNIAAGESLALVGPSGSGKTTLLRVLQAALRPDAGTCEIAGRLVSDMGPKELRRLRRRLGMVPQDLRLVPNLRVHQNVASGGLGGWGFWDGMRRIYWPPAAQLRTIHALLEELGIEEKLFVRTDHLSGGQQQRVALARALFQEPSVLLADEPVSAVDPARAEELIHQLSERAAKEGLGLIVSMHNLELARRFFPRLVGLREGNLHFDRRREDLSERDIATLYELTEGPEAHA
jgi:phosphonate transport system ATP-binding protein